MRANQINPQSTRSHRGVVHKRQSTPYPTASSTGKQLYLVDSCNGLRGSINNSTSTGATFKARR
jgi:hypothetical protein